MNIYGLVFMVWKTSDEPFEDRLASWLPCQVAECKHPFLVFVS